MKVIKHRNHFAEIDEVADKAEIKVITDKLIKRVCIITDKLKELSKEFKVTHSCRATAEILIFRNRPVHILDFTKIKYCCNTVKCT